MVVHHILEVYELLKSSSESSTNNTEQQLPEAPTGRKGYLSKSKELTDEQEMYLEALKDAGATIKVLSSSGSILAIFKTASAAKQALGTHCQHSLPQLATHTTPHTESIQSPYFKLRRWTTPAATPPVSGTFVLHLNLGLLLEYVIANCPHPKHNSCSGADGSNNTGSRRRRTGCCRNRFGREGGVRYMNLCCVAQKGTLYT